MWPISRRASASDLNTRNELLGHISQDLAHCSCHRKQEVAKAYVLVGSKTGRLLAGVECAASEASVRRRHSREARRARSGGHDTWQHKNKGKTKAWIKSASDADGRLPLVASDTWSEQSSVAKRKRLKESGPETPLSTEAFKFVYHTLQPTQTHVYKPF